MKTRLLQDEWKDQFNEEIYDYLVECGSNGDYKKWYKYLRSNKIKKIKLKGANLKNLNFSRFNLRNIDLEYSDLSFSEFNMSILNNVNMKEARVHGADFTKAVLMAGNFEKANFSSTNLYKSDCRFANFLRAEFHEAILGETVFDYSNMQKSVFKASRLEKASLKNTNLKGAEFIYADLRDASFVASMVNGETIFWDCKFSQNTDLTGVGLGNIRIDPQMKSGFENNIRRIWWKRYYENEKNIRINIIKSIKGYPVKYFYRITKWFMSYAKENVIKFFWNLTGYGASTFALIRAFFISVLVFSIIYSLFPSLNNTDLVIHEASWGIKFIRNIYFSIVVMTSVGFGDIYANGTSVFSYLIISIQILIGYVMLGALLVRLGILFQGGLPERAFIKYKGGHKNE
ncbi:MAG: pentapeptide repeat-containing protein [Tissierellales bacterium]|jgi:uncharacterized protein YjbI with pentapeptide repeats|nr:pentapeptide repeat-containing protein [Tissierellales bacterium]